MNCYSADNKQLVEEQLDLAEKAITQTKRAEEAILHCLKAEELMKEANIKDFKLKERLHLRFIVAFKMLDQPLSAIIHLKKLLQLMRNHDQMITQGYYINAGRLAGFFKETNALDSAYHYYRLSLEVASQLNIRVYKAGANNNLGLFFANQNKWELANTYYDKALQILELEKPEVNMLWFSIMDNKADALLANGDTTSAKEIIAKNLNSLYDLPKQHRRVISYGKKLLQLLLLQNELDSSRMLLESIEPHLYKEEGQWHIDNLLAFLELKLEINKILADKDGQLAVFFQIDSLRKIKSKKELSRTKKINQILSKYALESAEKEIEIVRSKNHEIKQSNHRKMFLLIFLIAMLSAFSLLIRSMYKRKLSIKAAEKELDEKELKLRELENEKLNLELRNKSNDFSDLMMQLSLKEGWSKEIIQQLEGLVQDGLKADLNGLRKVIRDLKQKAGINNRLDLQQKGIEQVNSAFFDRLDKSFPALTKAERELCALIRLRLDGKEIAIIRNIHPSSVRKLRYRLRKKLALEESENLYDFIGKI